MKFKIITAFVFFFTVSVFSIQAQETKTIKGIVQNANGSPLPGVVISVKETNQTVNINSEGTFEIRINRKNSITLVCTYLGFKTTQKQINLNEDAIENLILVMEENSNALEEVIITANKRESKLQKTPISVSAISSKEIQQRKMIDMTDLVMTVPNLITMSGGSPTLNAMSIRGIITFSTDPSIGVNIDGVPMFDGYATSMQLQDIERIEVLRGPQGTLYGRNALGGVINILTKQPDNTFKGFAEVGIGKFNMQEYRAGISSPLIKDKLFASVNGFYNTRKGAYKNEYTNSDFDDYKNYGGNFYLKYLATDRLSFVLNSKLEKNDINGTFPYSQNAAYAFENPYRINQNGRNIENRTLSTTSLFAKYQMDKWELTSLTAFNYLDDVYRDYDYDYSPYDFSYWNAPVRPQGTWTQEFKIASQNLGRWDITGGLFGFSDNRKAETYTSYGNDAVSMYPNAPYTLSTFSEQNGKGFAAFAHITYALSDKWKLTGGIRYDYDEKELTLHDEYIKAPNPTQIFPAKTVGTSDNAISPKINLAYLAAEDITMYANYAKGFRPGGVNQYASATSNYLSFAPEYTDNYEIGIKTEWLQRRLRANFAAFYTYWKDQQQSLMVPEIRIVNVGEMYSRGLELEITALPFKNLQINYNLGVVNTKYDKLLLLNEDNTDNVDYKGNKQIFTPDFSSALSVTYSGNITKDISFFIVPEWKYLGKQYMTYYNDLVQDPFSLLNANAGIKYKKYELKFWAKNITDSRYISYVYANYRGNNSPVLLGLPTTYGLSAKVNF